MSGLRVSLFGCPTISREGIGLTASRAEKVLLGFLALHPRRFHPRESIISLMWAELPDCNARHALRTAVWRLRKTLEPEGVARGTYLVSDRAGAVSLNWDSDLWVDVALFEKDVVALVGQPAWILAESESAKLQAAIQLYSGELLEGYYEDWVLRERERLRCLYVDALIRLMNSEAALGHHDSALTYGRRILGEDPLRESVQRRMIGVYLESGQRPQAIAHYRAYEQLLSRELGVSPMPETCALYAAALSLAEPASPPVAITEREDPRESLESVLAEMRQGQEQFDRARRRLRALLDRPA